MRITESRLRRIIRRVLVETSTYKETAMVVANLKRHGLISQLLMMPGQLAQMIYTGMIQEIIRKEMDACCGNHPNYSEIQREVEEELKKG